MTLLSISFGVLGLVIIAVIASNGDFPAGAVLISALIASATLAPRDAAVVAVADVGAGIGLAACVGGYTGRSLWLRVSFYVIAGAIAFVFSIIRVSREREVARNERLAHLHAFTAALFAAPDVDAITAVIAEQAPALLDAMTVMMMTLEAGGLAHAQGRSRDDGAADVDAVAAAARSAATDVARRRRPAYFENVAQYRRAYPDRAGVLSSVGYNALAAVPMQSDSGTIGVLIALYDTPQAFTENDRLAIEHVAHEVAIAIERAQLRAGEQEAAAKLQHSLLGPPILVPGVGHEARYLPAAASLHVGGDWYVAQRLADGRVGIAVGDVVGRGLDAATVMGQLRSALSAFAERSSGPAEALESLDAFARRIPGAIATSVAYARVDVWGRTIEYSLAGHPPPVVVTPAGNLSLLEDAIGPPLAVVASPSRRPTAARPFPPGSLILLYSDGLVERRREPLDVGLERLRESVRRHWRLPLSMLCDAVLADLIGNRERSDDVAMLALRSPVSSSNLLLLKRPATPDGLGEIRQELRAWLKAVDVDGDDADRMLVAVGEAATNAVEHAYRDDDGLVRVEATVIDGEVVCCVTDTGCWRDRVSARTRGNGLPIMRSLMDEVTVDRRETGTSVRFRYRPLNLVPA